MLGVDRLDLALVTDEKFPVLDAQSLRQLGVRARTITLKVKYADHRRVSRRVTLPRATADGRVVGPCLIQLLSQVPALKAKAEAHKATVDGTHFTEQLKGVTRSYRRLVAELANDDRMESATVLDRFIGEAGARPAQLLDAAAAYDAAWKPEADAVSWISERFLFGDTLNTLRSLVTMALGVNIADRAKRDDMSYSDVRRKAMRLGPLWSQPARQRISLRSM